MAAAFTGVHASQPALATWPARLYRSVSAAARLTPRRWRGSHRTRRPGPNHARAGRKLEYHECHPFKLLAVYLGNANLAAVTPPHGRATTTRQRKSVKGVAAVTRVRHPPVEI